MKDWKEKNMTVDTLCVQGGWQPKKGEPRQVPIYASTTFRYETSEQMADLFDLKASGYFYTRLANPTNDQVAKLRRTPRPSCHEHGHHNCHCLDLHSNSIANLPRSVPGKGRECPRDVRFNPPCVTFVPPSILSFA